MKENKLVTKNSKGEILEFKLLCEKEDRGVAWCFNNKLSEIISIPYNSTELDCSINELTSLPKLPKYLLRLNCEDNKLNSLPKILPNSLQELSCERNNIKQLTDLRIYKNLTTVDCDMCCFEDYMLEMKNTKFQFFC